MEVRLLYLLIITLLFTTGKSAVNPVYHACSVAC